MKKKMRSTLNAMRAAGPYVAIELFLPGGTLIAALLWLARRRAARTVPIADIRS